MKKTNILLLLLGIGLNYSVFADNSNSQSQAIINALSSNNSNSTQPNSNTGSAVKTNQVNNNNAVNVINKGFQQNNNLKQPQKINGSANVISSVQKINPATKAESSDPFADSDLDAVQISKLKRELEIKKLQADLNKNAQNTSVPPIIPSSGSSLNSTGGQQAQNGQTVVTGVASFGDQSIANLLFVDGSTLEVQKGSRLEMNNASYIITDISITGVTAKSYSKSGKLLKTVYIKRVYPKAVDNKTMTNNQGQSPYNPVPTQTFTSSNFDSPVPPITNNNQVQSPFAANLNNN